MSTSCSSRKASNQPVSRLVPRFVPAVEIAADQHVRLAHAAMPGAEAQAFEAGVAVHELQRKMAALGIQAASNAPPCSGRPLRRHPGLDPGSIFSSPPPTGRQGGYRIRSGMTLGETKADQDERGGHQHPAGMAAAGPQKLASAPNR